MYAFRYTLGGEPSRSRLAQRQPDETKKLKQINTRFRPFLAVPERPVHPVWGWRLFRLSACLAGRSTNVRMMFTPPAYNEELLDAPLWHVELPERRLCVAENGEGTFLVLFTSPLRAYDFIRREALGAGDPASPARYSITRDECMSRAETSEAG